MIRAIPRLAPTVLALLLATGGASAETLRPKFVADDFVQGQAIDNKYLPLVPGSRAVLRGRGVEDGERVRGRSVYQVLEQPGPNILGVTVTTLLDKAYENGRVVEKTYDYFAQDKRGNVWYLGEDVTNFRYDDQGNLIGKDNASAWRAGRRGAKPGWIMPARQIVGQSYFQERARRDEALDKGQTNAVLGRLRVGDTIYRNVLRVLETNPFEPGAREFKYYAPRVGLVRAEEALDRNLENPQVVFDRTDGDRRARAGKARDRRSERAEKRSGRSGKSRSR